ncbi:MAG: HU family DNA-binding protein [Bacteroides sp.]|nr:HU family DNA-binding protein [Bacteroides sp.]
MAKYIKQEMNDLSGKGEEKVYYRLQTERNISFSEFTQQIEQHHGIMHRGLVKNVMTHVVDAMAELLGNGYSVTIDGLGTFKATIGLEKDKVMDTFDGEDTKRNARSLRLTGINYRADKELVKKSNCYCRLERAGEARLHHSPYSKEERLKLAQQYLEKHGAMRVIQYMELTGLSRTKATLELKEFRQDVSTGITFLGRGSAKVYVKVSVEK